MKRFRKIECDESMARQKDTYLAKRSVRPVMLQSIIDEDGDRAHYPVRKSSRQN